MTLQVGQTCTGNPPCATGLECIGTGGSTGICSPECTGNPNGCPTDWSCAEFEGGMSFCLPSVDEGQSCEGTVACSAGPCLVTTTGRATCYLDCTNNAGVCNNAQQCITYPLQGGGSVSVCEPPGVPPHPPDAGVLIPDAGTIDEDAGGPIDQDGGVNTPDAGQTPQTCACDTTYSCDPNCGHCDPECSCDCDLTTVCDPECEMCDPECKDTGCIGCTSTSAPVDPFLSLGIGLLLIGLFLGRKQR